MNRKKIEKEYAKLAKQYRKGKLDREFFEQAVLNMHWRDGDGNEHCLDPDSGQWTTPGELPSRQDARTDVAEGMTAESGSTASPTDAIKGERTSRSTMPPPRRPGGEGSGPVPDSEASVPRFWPLFRQILAMTWHNFRRRLPLTLLIMLATGAVYFYFVIVRWGGYGSPSIPPGNFAWLERALASLLGVNNDYLTGFSSGLSGAVVLGVGVPLLFGFLRNLFTRGPVAAVGDIVSIPGQLGGYFHQAGGLALAGLAGGAGMALVAGAFVGGWANVMLAVGVGAAISSRMGQMLCLLFRSFWTATYGMAQGGRGREFSQAAGYVALFGGSFAFLLRTVLSPEVALYGGLAMLLTALLLARTSGPSPSVPASLLFGLVSSAMALAALNGWADDGGWKEALRPGQSPPLLEHFLLWLLSDGGFQGFANTLIPGLGAMLGPSFYTALSQALANGAYPGGPASSGAGGVSPGPVIYDADGEPLIVQDGTYEGGKPGQVWYDGEWMDPSEAQKWIDERKQQLRDRDRERDQFWRDVEKDKDRQRAEREADLQAQGYTWDADRQAWVAPDRKPGDYGNDKLNEIYHRRDWIDEHIHTFTPEQQAAAQRILDRIGADATGVNPDDLTDDDMRDLRRLTHALGNIDTAKHDAEAAHHMNREVDLAIAQFGFQTAAQVGQVAASRIDPSGGIVANAVFGAAQNWDKGLKGAATHAAVNAIGGLVDKKIGGLAPENILLNTLSGGTTNAVQTLVTGGTKEEVKQAFAIGGFAGGLGAAGTRLDRWLGDRKLPHIQAGNDPTLAQGSHGIGSNDPISGPKSHYASPSAGNRVRMGDVDVQAPPASPPPRGFDQPSGVKPADAGDGVGTSYSTPSKGPQVRTADGDVPMGTRGAAPDTDASAGMSRTGGTDEGSAGAMRSGDSDPSRLDNDSVRPADAPSADDPNIVSTRDLFDGDGATAGGARSGDADGGMVRSGEPEPSRLQDDSVRPADAPDQDGDNIFTYDQVFNDSGAGPTHGGEPDTGRFQDDSVRPADAPSADDPNIVSTRDLFDGDGTTTGGARSGDADGGIVRSGEPEPSRLQDDSVRPADAPGEGDPNIVSTRDLFGEGGGGARTDEGGADFEGLNRPEADAQASSGTAKTGEGSDPWSEIDEATGLRRSQAWEEPENWHVSGDPDASSGSPPERLGDTPGERDLVDSIRDDVAGDARTQRAEAAADKLRNGQDPGLDPDRDIPFSQKEWKAQDAAQGGPREPVVDPGITPSAEVKQFIDDNSAKYPWLKSTDQEIRDAWRLAGGGTDPHSWVKFQGEIDVKIKNGDLRPHDYERWYQVMNEGGLQRSPMQAAETGAGSGGGRADGGTFVPGGTKPGK
ncbi:hypothetical protein GM415_00555 [Pseudodesulfovibrio cashew]|uniref:Uncharacterized protein n=1 Tax=Pseudodesulfovibrio cashew TaxID=2678688 RepID=A0A6I6J9J1_9BACT|nr:hypothetical protein [Pseudodesulfovibrio cashew]QGY38691.1 hypothetical protein GM415_00555 [Pseudodesulfovibrio cashew]